MKKKEHSDIFPHFFVIYETPTELKISVSFQYFLIIKPERHSTKDKHTNYKKYFLYHHCFSLEIQNSLDLANRHLILGIPVIQIFPDHMTKALYRHWVVIYVTCLSHYGWTFTCPSHTCQSHLFNWVFTHRWQCIIFGKKIFIKVTNLSSETGILSHRHISYLTLFFVSISKYISVDISAAAI